MASGTIYLGSQLGNVIGDWEGRVLWSTSANSSSNTTSLTLTFQIKRNDSPGTGNSSSYSIDFKIVNAYDTSDVIAHYWYHATPKVIVEGGGGWTTIATKTFSSLIVHDNSGWAPNVALDGGFHGITNGVGFWTAPAHNTIIIPNITRVPYLNSATNFADVENPKITYYNPMGNSVSSLQAAISFTGADDDVPYRDVPKTGTSYTFELTPAERTTLINGVSNGSSVSVRFYLKSVINGSTYYKYLTRTFTLTDSMPILEPVAIDMNEATYALTGDYDTFIKGHSMAACQFNATAKQGAAILTYKVVNGSKTEERTTGLASIDEVESPDFVFTVIDSRGISATKTITKKFIDYFKPTCSQEATISLSDETNATVKLVVNGEWSSVHFGAVHNALRVEYRYKSGSGEWSEWSGTDYIGDDNTYKITFTIENLDYTKAYTFQSRAVDTLDSAETGEYTTKLIPIFDWSDEDFNFNVPVHFQQGFTVGDGATTGDYIVEQGTEAMGSNGTWYWEKWANGKAECYGVRNYGNMAVNKAWGNDYTSADFNQALPNIFNDSPFIMDIHIHGTGSGFAWIAKHGMPTANDSGIFNVMRPTSSTVQQVYISFHAIGRWK